MFDLQKWASELLSGKIPELAGLAFYSLVIVYLMHLYGIPFERYLENFEILVLLGIGLTFPFAAKPILGRMIPAIISLVSALQKTRRLKARVIKIKTYSKTKKQVLLFVFMGGENFLEVPDSTELAEMTADDVLEKHHGYYKVKQEIWKDLNARPDYRDQILERAALFEEIKPKLDAKR